MPRNYLSFYLINVMPFAWNSDKQAGTTRCRYRTGGDQFVAFVGHAVRLILQSFIFLFAGRRSASRCAFAMLWRRSSPAASSASRGDPDGGDHRHHAVDTRHSFASHLRGGNPGQLRAGAVDPQEFAPLITSIIVAGRSGSQLAGRIGSMRLNGEIDALTVVGLRRSVSSSHRH